MPTLSLDPLECSSLTWRHYQEEDKQCQEDGDLKIEIKSQIVEKCCYLHDQCWYLEEKLLSEGVVLDEELRAWCWDDEVLQGVLEQEIGCMEIVIKEKEEARSVMSHDSWL